MDQEVVETVRYYVRSGFYSSDEIEEIVTEELYEPGEVDVDAAKMAISDEFERLRAEQKTWPDVTDCDRLDRVFADLTASGIIALQNAGMTQSDGWSDVTEEYYDRGGPQSGVTGYCFYHGQDLERVVVGDDLYLAFGSIDQDDDRGVEVGRRIASAFQSHGFTVDWDGTFKRRIQIPGIDWKRRIAS